jgi:hypothetical protein
MSNMKKMFQELCTPAKIYFAIAVIGAIMALFNRAPLLAVLMKLIFAYIWTYILNWLCSKGLKTLSWVLVLLPYIVLFLVMFKIIKM